MKTIRVGRGVWFMGQTDFVHFAKFGDLTKDIRLTYQPISYCISRDNFHCLVVGTIPAYVNRTVVQKLLVLL